MLLDATRTGPSHGNITGLASISYRLSPHPSFPQDPENTPSYELRVARHPQHVEDVVSALAFLHSRYRFGQRYILVGHSCGATMAFQSVMPRVINRTVCPPPTAILGVAGIYDLQLLRDKHADISAYQDFIEGAFGSHGWDAVSPACVKGDAGVEGGWKDGRLAVLARSTDDELVDASQGEAMRDTLASNWANTSRLITTLSLRGSHDDAWKDGEELARAVMFTLDELHKMAS